MASRYSRAGSGLLHQNGAGIEQIKAPTLHILLRLRPRCVVMLSRVKSSVVWTPGRRCAGAVARPGELRDALCHAEAGAAGDDPVAQRDVARSTDRRERRASRGTKRQAFSGINGVDGARCGRFGWAGILRVKVEPVPGLLESWMEPPWLAATCLTMARPSPVPPVDRLRA